MRSVSWYLLASLISLVLSVVALEASRGGPPPTGVCLSAEELDARVRTSDETDACDWSGCTYQCGFVSCTGRCTKFCDFWSCGNGCVEVGCSLPY